jgi:hypothetical protein
MCKRKLNATETLLTAEPQRPEYFIRFTQVQNSTTSFFPFITGIIPLIGGFHSIPANLFSFRLTPVPFHAGVAAFANRVRRRPAALQACRPIARPADTGSVRIQRAEKGTGEAVFTVRAAYHSNELMAAW